MTREEIIEDLSLNDKVKIYTESNEMLIGQILDIGVSGLKICLLDGLSTKRIAYERIVEYDLYDDSNNHNTNTQDIISSNVYDSLRKDVFTDFGNSIIWEEMRSLMKKGLSQKEKSDSSRLENILKYAKKINEFTIESDRVIRAIGEYKSFANQNASFFSFIGIIYAELNDTHKAIDYLEKGGCYIGAFKLLMSNSLSREAYENAMRCVQIGQDDEDVIHWLCLYAIRIKDISIIRYICDNKSPYYKKALLYWYADDSIVNAFNDPLRYDDELISELNQKLLQDSIAGTNVEHSKPVPSSTKTPELDEKQEWFQGEIVKFNYDGGYGFIREKSKDSLFFHIKQVHDKQLRRILESRGSYRQRVKFIKGLNYKGDIAADCIELLQDSNVQISSSTFSGVLEEYDFYDEYGRINCDNHYYDFFFNEIKDPILYADMKMDTNQIKKIEVTFNIKTITKANKKQRTVACNIVSAKDYSDEEIKSLIESGSISQTEVDSWTYKDFSDEYEPLDYEPLKPLPPETKKGDVEKNANKSEVVIKREIPAARNVQGEIDEETQICRMLIPTGTKNPFIDLPRTDDREDSYRMALYYCPDNNVSEISRDDLIKAEELFIESLKTRNQTIPTIHKLLMIYMRLGDEYVIKGLLLIDAFKNLFPEEKVTNIRIMLVDRSGNMDVLEKLLILSIPKCSKGNTVYQYTGKLARIYYNQSRWKEAAIKYKDSLEFVNSHKQLFSKDTTLKESVWRNYIICIYKSGNVDLAIEQAGLFLKDYPDDSTALSIVNSSAFEPEENLFDIVGFEDFYIQMEDDLLNNDADEISTFLLCKIQKVNLSSTFNKVKEVYQRTQDGVFIGDIEDYQKAVKTIKDFLLLKSGSRLSAEYKSGIYIGMAKLAYDSRNSTSAKEKERIDIKEVCKFGGYYSRFLADDFVEKYSTIDSIRFLYILAINTLNGSVPSFNILIASFFIDGHDLPDELHNIIQNHPNDYITDYFGRNCISIKDLLIATFMLQNQHKETQMVLKGINEHEQLRNGFEQCYFRVTNKLCIADNTYSFEQLWKEIKDVYCHNIELIGKEIKNSIESLNMVESIRQHVQKLNECLDIKLLWNQDEKFIKQYIGIISLIADTVEKYSVEEKIEGYRNIELDINKLHEDIESSPTALGYDYLYYPLESLKLTIREQFNELYRGTMPECSICLSNDSVYVSDNTVDIVILFNNLPDRQDADAVEIQLEGSQGALFLKCQKTFTSIKSGESQEYYAVFSLCEDVIADHQFDVTVHLTYQYYDVVDSIQTKTISETLPITISDKNAFIPIVNKYNRIFRGSGVDVKTPELFKGRDDMIESLCNSMSTTEGIMTKNRGIILWGQRRVGKNSVKDYLKERIRQSYSDAYLIIELGSIGKCRNLKEVLITIINKTEDTLMTDYSEVYEKLLDLGMVFNSDKLEKSDNYLPEFSRFMDRLSSRLATLGDGNHFIPLYFIDEFSYLYEWIEKGDIDGKEFMRFWKSFIQDYGICAIIIAQDNIPVWKSRYENEFACMNHDNEITYLDYEGAKELICEPCQTGEKPLFTDDAVKLIFDWTLGSAYLIVIFCKYIIDYMNEHYMERATKTIVQLVFEKEFLEKREMFLSEDFEPQVQDVSNVGEEGKTINKANEQLLREIAVATISSAQTRISDLPIFNSDKEFAEKVFNRLKERKIIEVDKNTFCSIKMPLLKLYLLREQSLLNKDILNKISR